MKLGNVSKSETRRKFMQYNPISAGNVGVALDTEYTLADFFKLAEATSSEVVNRVNQATVSMFNSKGEFYGNAVAIASDLLLTSGHCVPEEQGYLRNQTGLVKCKVVFDGSICNVDFKILQLAKANFKPVELSVSHQMGESAQVYSNVKDNKLVRCVKVFESDMADYASRSNVASAATAPGESGAPRVSLISGWVHAIHQGEREGLTINSVYQVLEQSAKNNAVAADILKRISVKDLEYRYMDNSVLRLEIGDVVEEKPRLGGKVIVEDKDKKKTTFGYAEVGTGKGQRWIDIHAEGIKDSKVRYAITPNPHNNHKYNNKGQEGFYGALAKSLANSYQNAKAFPKRLQGTVYGEVYTCTKE
jgi:hypothetical protein